MLYLCFFYLSELLANVWQTLSGPFSAVSKPYLCKQCILKNSCNMLCMLAVLLKMHYQVLLYLFFAFLVQNSPLNC